MKEGKVDKSLTVI